MPISPPGQDRSSDAPRVLPIPLLLFSESIFMSWISPSSWQVHRQPGSNLVQAGPSGNAPVPIPRSRKTRIRAAPDPGTGTPAAFSRSARPLRPAPATIEAGRSRRHLARIPRSGRATRRMVVAGAHRVKTAGPGTGGHRKRVPAGSLLGLTVPASGDGGSNAGLSGFLPK